MHIAFKILEEHYTTVYCLETIASSLAGAQVTYRLLKQNLKKKKKLKKYLTYDQPKLTTSFPQTEIITQCHALMDS